MDIARFWNRVDVGSPTTCWPWTGPLREHGQGEFKVDGANKLVHRVAFELAFGEIPEGMVVRHTCDNGACCNPKHLLTGTHADNVRDRVIRQRGAIGENAGRAKLNNESVLTIRGSKATAKTLAAQYGVSEATIHGIRQGRSWKHLPAN